MQQSSAMEDTKVNEQTLVLEEPEEKLESRVSELKEILRKSNEVKGTKNLSEHLNCTKQECGAAWW